eukprot:2182950-Rhodomonas_salina.2
MDAAQMTQATNRINTRHDCVRAGGLVHEAPRLAAPIVDYHVWPHLVTSRQVSDRVLGGIPVFPRSAVFAIVQRKLLGIQCRCGPRRIETVAPRGEGPLKVYDCSDNEQLEHG